MDGMSKEVKPQEWISIEKMCGIDMTEVRDCADVQRMGQMGGYHICALKRLRCAK